MKVLIVKTSSLGDIIHAFPVLPFLHRLFPDVQIDWVAEEPFAELVKAHPLIRHVHVVETRMWRKGRRLAKLFQLRRQLKSLSYDVVFDLQGNMKSALPTFWANSMHKVGYGKETVFERLNLLVTNHQFNPPVDANVREENLFLVESFFHKPAIGVDAACQLQISEEERLRLNDFIKCLPVQRKVMVCPGSTWQNKQMPIPSLSRFLQQIPDSHFIVIWGTQDEKQIAESLCLQLPNSTIADRMPIPVLQNLMGHMDQVIAMDSLPLHLAATTTVPTYSIFGASSAKKYQPIGSHHHAFQGSCPYGRTFIRRCPILRSCSTGSCVRSLTGDEVYQDYKVKMSAH
jgi:heptosyltransferase I